MFLWVIPGQPQWREWNCDRVESAACSRCDSKLGLPRADARQLDQRGLLFVMGEAGREARGTAVCAEHPIALASNPHRLGMAAWCTQMAPMWTNSAVVAASDVNHCHQPADTALMNCNKGS